MEDKAMRVIRRILMILTVCCFFMSGAVAAQAATLKAPTVR